MKEIYRILKQGMSAYIFETYKDHDKELFRLKMDENLKGYNFIRRSLSKHFLKKQLKMTYSLSDFDSIIKQTSFCSSYNIEQIELGNLSIYLRIELRKEKKYEHKNKSDGKSY